MQDVFNGVEILLSGCFDTDVSNREIFVLLITPEYELHESNDSRWCLSKLAMVNNENKKMRSVTAKYPLSHIVLQLALNECCDFLGVNFLPWVRNGPKNALILL